MLEMVCRNPLSLRMLLSSGGPRIEEVVDTLEGTTSLPGYLGIFAQGILQLYI